MGQFAHKSPFDTDLLETVDMKIALWRSQLPMTKKDPLQKDGTVDEVMFMAHMIGAIPLSLLASNKAELSAASSNSPALSTIPASVSRHAHTSRALKAAEIHTKLLAIPCTIEKHNVLCMAITVSIAKAQISACNNLLEDHALSIGRDRVKLSIGFLSAMGSIWASGKAMAKDVRTVARSTLKAPSETSSVEYDPSAEIEIPRDDLIWPIDPSADVDIYSGIVMPLDWEQASSGYAASHMVEAADPKFWRQQS
ncbi:hypothetical protein E8E13_010196 [Curvularia kusanoi]|uniref:C6 transcription factor n=1 Tax=Curvularia kusanoi TaxID=90978 RepID=A0A9P4THH8_CURKU|nr:hypothetical protein E8E13_010196 [Curvularia kusanoi]